MARSPHLRDPHLVRPPRRRKGVHRKTAKASGPAPSPASTTRSNPGLSSRRAPARCRRRTRRRRARAGRAWSTGRSAALQERSRNPPPPAIARRRVSSCADQIRRREQRCAVVRRRDPIEVLQAQLDLAAIGIWQAGQQPRKGLAEIAKTDQPQRRGQVSECGSLGSGVSQSAPGFQRKVPRRAGRPSGDRWRARQTAPQRPRRPPRRRQAGSPYRREAARVAARDDTAAPALPGQRQPCAGVGRTPCR